MLKGKENNWVRNICHLIMVVVSVVLVTKTVSSQVSEVKITDRSDAPLTVEDAYHLALQRSEELGKAAQDIAEAKARYQESLASLYPNVRFGVTQRLSNGASGSSPTGSVGAPDSSGSRSKHPFQSYFSATQPIFSGFRERLLSEAIESEISAIEHLEVRKRELLYGDVAQLFHQVLMYEEDLTLLKKTEEVLRERIFELRGFMTLGKSREGEILAAEADIADLKSSEEQTFGLLNSSKELLGSLVGFSSQQLKLKLDVDRILIPDLNVLIAKLADRRDLKAAERQERAAELQVTVAERERWPNISIVGNAYPYQDPEGTEDWDILVKMEVPVFTADAIKSRIDQQQAQLQKRRLDIQEIKRLAERDVRVAHADLAAAQAQVAALEKLVKTNERNYRSQRSDYSLGVVTNLEVLQAIRQMQESKRRLEVAKANAAISLSKLQVVTGGIQ